MSNNSTLFLSLQQIGSSMFKCSSNTLISLIKSWMVYLSTMSLTSDLLFSITNSVISWLVYLSFSLRQGGNRLILSDIGYSGFISILISTLLINWYVSDLNIVCSLELNKSLYTVWLKHELYFSTCANSSSVNALTPRRLSLRLLLLLQESFSSSDSRHLMSIMLVSLCFLISWI